MVLGRPHTEVRPVAPDEGDLTIMLTKAQTWQESARIWKSKKTLHYGAWNKLTALLRAKFYIELGEGLPTLPSWWKGNR